VHSLVQINKSPYDVSISYKEEYIKLQITLKISCVSVCPYTSYHNKNTTLVFLHRYYRTCVTERMLEAVLYIPSTFVEIRFDRWDGSAVAIRHEVGHMIHRVGGYMRCGHEQNHRSLYDDKSKIWNESSVQYFFFMETIPMCYH